MIAVKTNMVIGLQAATIQCSDLASAVITVIAASSSLNEPSWANSTNLSLASALALGSGRTLSNSEATAGISNCNMFIYTPVVTESG